MGIPCGLVSQLSIQVEKLLASGTASLVRAIGSSF